MGMYGLLLFGGQFLEAVGADVFALKGFHAAGAAAENAVGLMLLQYDRIALHKDFQLVSLINVQYFSQFTGQDNSSQIIDSTYDSSRFHCNLLLYPSISFYPLQQNRTEIPFFGRLMTLYIE